MRKRALATVQSVITFTGTLLIRSFRNTETYQSYCLSSTDEITNVSTICDPRKKKYFGEYTNSLYKTLL